MERPIKLILQLFLRISLVSQIIFQVGDIKVEFSYDKLSEQGHIFLLKRNQNSDRWWILREGLHLVKICQNKDMWTMWIAHLI